MQKLHSNTTATPQRSTLFWGGHHITDACCALSSLLVGKARQLRLIAGSARAGLKPDYERRSLVSHRTCAQTK